MVAAHTERYLFVVVVVVVVVVSCHLLASHYFRERVHLK
jgi:hypothetical protein